MYMACKLKIYLLIHFSSFQIVFDQERHVDVLDLVCVQCEPDSADYIRVRPMYTLESNIHLNHPHV